MGALALLWACAGPPASDGALCRDVAHRICISECGTAYNALGLQNAANCDAVLQQRTGCTDDTYSFEAAGIDRASFLSCRLPILRAGDDVEQRPDCTDVDDMFRGCPQLLNYYQTGRP